MSDPLPARNNQQLFNFESSSYGYGFRNWTGEQEMYNQPQVPQISASEVQHQNEMMRQHQLVEKAKNDLLARFPYYALNLQNERQANQREMSLLNDIPMPVEVPQPVEPPAGYDFWPPPESY